MHVLCQGRNTHAQLIVEAVDFLRIGFLLQARDRNKMDARLTPTSLYASESLVTFCL